MQTETTYAPFLPMGQQGEQGYEAHFELSETLESTQFHCHDYYEFYFFVEGDVAMEIDGTSHQLRPGDVIVVPPGIVHRAILTDSGVPYRRFVFWISKACCDDLLKESMDYMYVFQLYLNPYFTSPGKGRSDTFRAVNGQIDERVVQNVFHQRQEFRLAFEMTELYYSIL